MMIKGIHILLVWIATSCVTTGAHPKDQPWKPGMERFFKALTREVDTHLKMSLRQAIPNQVSTEATSDLHTDSEYSKALQTDIETFFDTLKQAVNNHAQKGSGFPISIKKLKTPPASQTTEVYTKAHRTTTEGPTNAYRSTTKVYASTPKSTAKVYSTTPRSTTEVYSTTPQSTTEIYEEGQHDIKEGHGEDGHDTEEGYGKDGYYTTGGYGKERRSTDCVYSTTEPHVAHGYPIRVGSIKGVPGVHFPNYTDIPITSFTCYDKEFQPGFYADMETGCQVFHVCWSNRRESFLCPLGTIFNQALLVCDYWYSTNCSLSPHYYNVNAETSQYEELDLKSESVSSMINLLVQKGHFSAIPTEGPAQIVSTPDTLMSFVSQFLPIKAKVVVYPETEEKRAKIVATTSIGSGKVQKSKTQETLVLSQGPVTDRPSHAEDVSKSTSKLEIPKDEKKQKIDEAYRKAVKIFLDKLSVAVKIIIQEIDSAEKDTKPFPHSPGKHTPVEGKLKFAVGPDFSQYDATTKMALDKLIEDMVSGFRQELKVKDKVQESVAKYTVKEVQEPVYLTQLNPRFVIKPAAVQIEKKEPVPDPKKRLIIKHPKTTMTKSGRNIGLNIMPLTKKKLTSNYIRLLKIKSA